MSNLTGLQNGVFNSLQLIDDTTGDSTEVRQLFLQGSLEQSIPNNPQNNQVLSIPGLLPELNARQLISNSYSRTEVDTLIQNNPGPKGDKGAKGAGSKGLKGDVGASTAGAKGQKGDQGSIGQKGDQGLIGTKGQKGSSGQKGDQGSGQKGDQGQKGDKGQAQDEKKTEGNYNQKIGFKSLKYSVAESNGHVTITIEKKFRGEFSFWLRTKDGTAKAPDDYIEKNEFLTMHED